MWEIIFLFCSTLAAVEIELGGHLLDVEISSTPESRSVGLSGRYHLEDGKGMLFIYEEPQIGRFWMKNTLIPLSIGFIDKNKFLIHWEDMDVPEPDTRNLTIYTSKKPVLYALEVPQGWFERAGIKRGAKLQFVKKPSPDQSNSIK